MSSQQLIRWGGLAAMLAGALRTAASFLPPADPGVALEILYLVIDILLLFGILGIYAFQHDRIGWSGFVGFVLAVIGLTILAGPDGTIGVVNTYALARSRWASGLFSWLWPHGRRARCRGGSRPCGCCQPCSVSSAQRPVCRVSSS